MPDEITSPINTLPPAYDRDSNPPPAGPRLEKKRVPSRRQILTKLATAKDLITMIFLPILNLVCTAILMGSLIYVYINADGKDINHTMGSMKIPALVSLIATLMKMCLVGGIGYAVSEYKWVRLQNGGRLSLIDVYDACTRGVGGFIRVLEAIHFDIVLVPAILFQIGMIAFGPVSQVLLVPSDKPDCYDIGASLTYNPADSTALWTLKYPYDPRTNIGVKNGYAIVYGFDTAAYHFRYPITSTCKRNATECTFNDIPVMRTEIDCQPGSFQETQVYDGRTRTTQTLAQYYNYSNGDPSTHPSVPAFYYAGSMQGRTMYDFPTYATPVNLNATFNPALLAYVGNQTFVVVSHQGRADNASTVTADNASVSECTLLSYVDTTKVTLQGRKTTLDVVASRPIAMDFTKLANASYWQAVTISSTYPLPPQAAADLTMMTMYSLQVGMVNNLVILNQETLQGRIAGQWVSNNGERNTIENMINDMIHSADRFATFSAQTLEFMVQWGRACYPNGTVYHTNPAAFYTFSLIPLVPVVWWVTLWVISLYQMNGIMRGNSQIALLVTGLTAAARQKFKGLSHAGQNTLFKYASHVDITFGEVKRADDRPGHVAFGLQDEMNPIRARRRSVTGA